MTNGEVVSRVLNNLNSLTKDDHISRRFILATARNATENIIRTLSERGALLKDSDLFQYINCFPLMRDDVISCGIDQFKRCAILLRSVNQVPKLISDRFGDGVVSVKTIDDRTIFNRVPLEKYSYLSQLKVPKWLSKKYFYVKDRYIYLPDPISDTELEAVNIVLFTLYSEKVDELSNCPTCPACESAWDKKFVCPSGYEDVVIQQTLGLVGKAKAISKDENPNLNANQRV